MPYVRRPRKDNFVRVAIICGVDKVFITGTKNKKYHRNFEIQSNSIFPQYFSGHNKFVRVNGKEYRGNLEIEKINNRIWVINIVNMEDYLKGVVPCEIGEVSRSLIEAAKAQTVAARTYAYAHLNQYQELGFDLYATVQDQVYKGKGCENKLTNHAIRQTKGQILTFRGQPIEAKYHSTCGGRTADFNDAWSGYAPPYLKSVGCLYCKNSPHYDWHKIFSKKKFFSNLRSRLKRIGIEIPGKELVKSVKLHSNKKSKRIVKLIIKTDRNEYAIQAYHIRTVLGENKDPGGLLKSNLVNMKLKNKEIIIKGKGYGHGVGMCQFGAMGMARQNKNYRQILYHYYPGTRIGKIH
jgi:stage II sporulation protein D